MIIKKSQINLNEYHNKYIFTREDNRIYQYYLQNDKLIEVDVESAADDAMLRSIYVGKVQNIAQNIGAAFVEYSKNKMGYLDLSQVKNPILNNREYNGCLKSGDEILVQIEKEAFKSKDPVLTTNLSLSGMYSVVSYEKKSLNYSKKIPKDRQKEIGAFLKENEEILHHYPYGMLIRTNANNLVDYEPILNEYNQLSSQLEAIIQTGKSRVAFSNLYNEESFVGKKVKNAPIQDSIFITDQLDIYEEIIKKSGVPCFLYEDKTISLNALYSLTTKLSVAKNKRVWLKSGAYLIIEVTEALTVIDVNTGKCVHQKDKETMFMDINLEAAKEIAYQLRLRNLSGIILVDFINMKSSENQTILLKQLEKHCKEDMIQTDVIDITQLGLVEMTRKKISRPLYDKLQD